jgi:hypothetical protein
LAPRGVHVEHHRSIGVTLIRDVADQVKQHMGPGNEKRPADLDRSHGGWVVGEVSLPLLARWGKVGEVIVEGLAAADVLKRAARLLADRRDVLEHVP